MYHNFFDDEMFFENNYLEPTTLPDEVNQIITTANKLNYNPNIISYLTRYLTSNLSQEQAETYQLHSSKAPNSNKEDILLTTKDNTFLFNFDKDFIFFSKLNNDINKKDMLSLIFPLKAGDSTSIFELNAFNTKENYLFRTALTFDNLDFENCAFMMQQKDCYKMLNNGDTSYFCNLDLSSILDTEPTSVLFDSHSRIHSLVIGFIEYEESKFIDEVKNFGSQQPIENAPDYFAFE